MSATSPKNLVGKKRLIPYLTRQDIRPAPLCHSNLFYPSLQEVCMPPSLHHCIYDATILRIHALGSRAAPVVAFCPFPISLSCRVGLSRDTLRKTPIFVATIVCYLRRSKLIPFLCCPPPRPPTLLR